MQVDEFTTTLLEIHDKMTSTNKNEDIRLGLNRSEYMLDSETSSVLQIDYLIIISWPWLPCLLTMMNDKIF
ncbi:Glutathione synthetase chloroplastic [Zea mays]|uniref:Glutathione synthetase chloroplastic n=1 Tax=Zea mays TaxID=4577 RepID=A0A1D6F7U8_MAIZE|nr:Glutathione synthetase chloroplastic [Zea mays]